MDETKTPKKTLMDDLEKKIDKELQRKLHWKGSFEDYMSVVKQNPKLAKHEVADIPGQFDRPGKTTGTIGQQHPEIGYPYISEREGSGVGRPSPHSAPYPPNKLA